MRRPAAREHHRRSEPTTSPRQTPLDLPGGLWEARFHVEQRGVDCFEGAKEAAQPWACRPPRREPRRSLSMDRHRKSTVPKVPGEVVLKALWLLFVAWLWIGILIDQMPCFLGVQNCD
jgi:hypothetical protein